MEITTTASPSTFHTVVVLDAASERLTGWKSWTVSVWPADELAGIASTESTDPAVMAADEPLFSMTVEFDDETWRWVATTDFGPDAVAKPPFRDFGHEDWDNALQWCIDQCDRVARVADTRTHNLPPVTITQRDRNLRTGRVEVWAARSTDGRWAFDRVEGDPSTPWLVAPIVDGKVLAQASCWATSLLRARKMIADCPAELVRYAAQRVVELAGLAVAVAECEQALEAYRSWFPAADVETGEAIARLNLDRRAALTQLVRR